jgi:hypothetical protein
VKIRDRRPMYSRSGWSSTKWPPAGPFSATSAPEMLHAIVTQHAERPSRWNPQSLRCMTNRFLTMLRKDRKAMGMRGRDSNTVVLDNVFVAADSIGIRRPMGKYHRVRDLVLTVALPLVGGAYLDVAEASGRIARENAIRRGDDGVTCELLGELENELTTEVLVRSRFLRRR